MGMRGRKSAASLSVVTPLPLGRPAPPEELSEEQAEEWRAVVARMPPDWFTRETHALLCQYVRHVTNARGIGRQLKEFRSEWLKEDNGLRRYELLTRIAEREGRAMGALARAMRLTQQSRYVAAKAHTATKNAGKERKPWEQAG